MHKVYYKKELVILFRRKALPGIGLKYATDMRTFFAGVRITD